MTIVFDDVRKDLPSDQLYRLFNSAGWVKDSTTVLQNDFNKPFINSTLVVSAWDNGKLIGAVRVLSDKMRRTILVLHTIPIGEQYKHE